MEQKPFPRAFFISKEELQLIVEALFVYASEIKIKDKKYEIEELACDLQYEINHYGKERRSVI